MTTIYLRAADESSLWAALEAAGLAEYLPNLVDDEGNVIEPGRWHCPHFLVLAGHMSVETGEVDAEGMPVMAPIDGYHANLYDVELTEEQAALLPIIPPPRNPRFVRA